MAELRIHQERLDEDSIRQLIDICPFGAISCRDGKVEIDSGCRMCRLCVKKGPGGAVEYMETQEPGINKDEWRAVAVYVEYNGKAVHPVTFELIGKAREPSQAILCMRCLWGIGWEKRQRNCWHTGWTRSLCMTGRSWNISPSSHTPMYLRIS